MLKELVRLDGSTVQPVHWGTGLRSGLDLLLAFSASWIVQELIKPC